MALLDHKGNPISVFKKEKPLALGPSFGAWAGRDSTWGLMPGGAMLQFDLSQLTLADFRAMRYSPQINSSLSVLTFMLHQVDWTIQGGTQKQREVIEDIMKLTWTRLVRAMAQAFWAGFSPIAIELTNNVQEKRVEVDKFKDLIPEDCRVHWKTVEGTYRPPDAGPGFMPQKFKIYDGIDQWGSQYPIPADNTLWYPLLMENGDFYGRKLLKAAFAPWYFSTLIHLFANRYYERFGEPTPIGRAPFDEEWPIPGSPGQTISGRDAMELIVTTLRNRGAVVLPSDIQNTGNNSGAPRYDYDIQFLESQMRGADFERYMSRLDEEMSLSLFTPLLLLRNADVGSHNLGVQHTQTWLWMLNAITGDMKEYIDRFVVKRLAAYNFGPNVSPRIEWVPKKMGKENVETLRGIITELVRANRVKFDLEEMGQALGMKLEEVEEVLQDPANPEGDPDTRINRDKNKSKDTGPKGVGEPRATGREISNRVKSQVHKAFKENTFKNGLSLSMGHKRRFWQSLVAEGAAADKAESMTNEFYTRMERWIEDAVGLEYSSATDFMASFDRLLDSEIERLRA